MKAAIKMGGKKLLLVLFSPMRKLPVLRRFSPNYVCIQTTESLRMVLFYYFKLQAVKRKLSLLPLGSFVYNEWLKAARGRGTAEEGRMLPEQKQHTVPFKFTPSWPTAQLPWPVARRLGQRLPPLAKTEEKGLLFNTGRLVSAREKNKKKGNYIN